MGLVFLFPRRALFVTCSLAQRKEKLRPENQLHLHVSTGLGGSPLFLKSRIGRLTSEADFGAATATRFAARARSARRFHPPTRSAARPRLPSASTSPGCSEMGLQCFLSKKTHLSLVKEILIFLKGWRSHTGSRTRAAWVKTRNPNR